MSDLLKTPLICFYGGTGTHPSGRDLGEYWKGDMGLLEHGHDYIQWMFPLPERSRAQPQSPVMTPEDLEEFKVNPTIRRRVMVSLNTMATFYGKSPQWCVAGNHNLLRITRILRSLTLMELHTLAQEFFEFVSAKAKIHKLPDQTIWYWEEALKPQPAWLKESI